MRHGFIVVWNDATDGALVGPPTNVVVVGILFLFINGLLIFGLLFLRWHGALLLGGRLVRVERDMIFLTDAFVLRNEFFIFFPVSTFALINGGVDLSKVRKKALLPIIHGVRFGMREVLYCSKVVN